MASSYTVVGGYRENVIALGNTRRTTRQKKEKLKEPPFKTNVGMNVAPRQIIYAQSTACLPAPPKHEAGAVRLWRKLMLYLKSDKHTIQIPNGALVRTVFLPPTKNIYKNQNNIIKIRVRREREEREESYLNWRKKGLCCGHQLI